MQYTGPPRGEATSGSCFPPDFRGSCSGTPPECKDCKIALSCLPEVDEEENIVGALRGQDELKDVTGETGEGSPELEPNPDGFPCFSSNSHCK